MKEPRVNCQKWGTNRVLNRESATYLGQRQVANSASVSETVLAVAEAAENKKAKDTLILDVRELTSLADFFVITGGDSVSQTRAIADAIVETLSKLGEKPTSIEGKTEGRWVLLDYGDVIVHVLHDKERSFYKLEQFWNQAVLVNK